MLECKVCGFKETVEEKMIGIFARGSILSATHGKNVGLYGCPKCHTVVFTDDNEYIAQRKKEYKQQMTGK